MATYIRCPDCRSRYRLTPAFLGKKMKCPKCGTVFQTRRPPRTTPQEGARPLGPSPELAVVKAAPPPLPRSTGPSAKELLKKQLSALNPQTVDSLVKKADLKFRPADAFSARELLRRKLAAADPGAVGHEEKRADFRYEPTAGKPVQAEPTSAEVEVEPGAPPLQLTDRPEEEIQSAPTPSALPAGDCSEPELPVASPSPVRRPAIHPIDDLLQEWREARITDVEWLTQMAALAKRWGHYWKYWVLLGEMHLARRDLPQIKIVVDKARKRCPNRDEVEQFVERAEPVMRSPGEAARCTEVLRGHSEPLEYVAVDASGAIAVTGGSKAELRVWDLKAGKCRGTTCYRC